MKDFPLMYKGWLIRTTFNYATIERLADGVKFDIKFKHWDVCKEFIDNLKTIWP